MKAPITIILTILSYTIHGQDIQLTLPSMQTCIDSAIEKSASVGYFVAKVERMEKQVSLARREIFKYVKVDAYYGGGQFGDIALIESSTSDPLTSTRSVTQQRYVVGASASIPLSVVTNRKKQTDLYKSEKNQAAYEIENAKKAVADEVIEVYHSVVLSQKLLRIKTLDMENMELSYLKAKKDFENGLGEIADYAIVQQMYYKAQADHAIALTKLSETSSLLEELTGLAIKNY